MNIADRITIHYTKTFQTGALAGLAVPQTVTFPTRQSAQKFIASLLIGVHRDVSTCPLWLVSDINIVTTR